MIGGLTGRPGRVLHGAGDADADADEVVTGAAGGDEQLAGDLERPVEHGLRPVGDPEPPVPPGGDRAREVGEGDHAVGGTEVGRDDDPRSGLKANRAGAARRSTTASPEGVTSPASASRSMREAMVERAIPVVSASCARVRGMPSRRIASSSAASAATSTESRGLSVMRVLNHTAGRQLKDMSASLDF